MAYCVYGSTPNAFGDFQLFMEPTAVDVSAGCANADRMMLLTPGEVQALGHSPWWDITAADGAQIGGAILFVWVTGWAFRVIKKTLDIDATASLN